jgi:interferon-induced GTP-binding protein Mx1
MKRGYSDSQSGNTGMELFEGSRYRNFVDLLRSHGAGNMFSLPQIAVVGDQSSGKSSVLTSLAGSIEFPSSSTLTTRCATQVIMTRSDKESICLYSSSKNIRTICLNGKEDIMKYIDAVQKCLITENSGKLISTESIIIELKSKDIPDVTLIDLPGLIRSVTKGQSDSDVEDVRNTVNKYMVEPRTVILAVVPGNVDLQTSEIIQLARKYDPKFKRTVIVITKPDLVEKGTENSLISQAEDLAVPFHIVRCRGHEERTQYTPTEMRNLENTFFHDPKWNRVPKEFLGIENLQTRLSDLLSEKIKEELPKVKAEMIQKLKESQKQLNELGNACETESERSMEFQSTLNSLQSICYDMVKGNYYKSEFFEEKVRFMSIVRELESKFNATIISLNVDRREYDIGDPVYYKGEWIIIQEKTTFSTDKVKVDNGSNNTILKSELIQSTPPHLCNIISRIKKSRGEELTGILSWNVLRTLIWEEVSCWLNPSRELLSKVFEHLHEISLKVVNFVCKNQRLRLFLKDKIKEIVNNTHKSTEEEINKVFEKEKKPSTENHYFFDEIQKKATIRNRISDEKV